MGRIEMKLKKDKVGFPFVRSLAAEASPLRRAKDQTLCESRGALGSWPTRSSCISAQGCARHPPMHHALLQDACQCPFLPTLGLLMQEL